MQKQKTVKKYLGSKCPVNASLNSYSKSPQLNALSPKPFYNSHILIEEDRPFTPQNNNVSHERSRSKSGSKIDQLFRNDFYSKIQNSKHMESKFLSPEPTSLRNNPNRQHKKVASTV